MLAFIIGVYNLWMTDPSIKYRNDSEMIDAIIQYRGLQFRNDWFKHLILDCTVYEWLIDAFSIGVYSLEMNEPIIILEYTI